MTGRSRKRKRGQEETVSAAKTETTKAKTSKSKKESKKEKDKNEDHGDEAERSTQYWLLKSEPESRFEKGVDMKFGIDDLIKEPDETACWDGVRNYAARNILRDQMKIGDLGFFYHSNCKVPGIVGIVEIVKEGYPDDTQFKKSDAHYDPASKKDNPRWFMVDVKFKRKLKNLISLHELKDLHQKHKASGGALAKMALFTRARLSVQPVSKDEWDFILGIEEEMKE